MLLSEFLSTADITPRLEDCEHLFTWEKTTTFYSYWALEKTQNFSLQKKKNCYQKTVFSLEKTFPRSFWHLCRKQFLYKTATKNFSKTSELQNKNKTQRPSARTPNRNVTAHTSKTFSLCAPKVSSRTLAKRFTFKTRAVVCASFHWWQNTTTWGLRTRFYLRRDCNFLLLLTSWKNPKLFFAKKKILLPKDGFFSWKKFSSQLLTLV